jgi:hypothetical protein
MFTFDVDQQYIYNHVSSGREGFYLLAGIDLAFIEEHTNHTTF